MEKDIYNQENRQMGREHQEGTDWVWKIETNLDDCSGEVLGCAMEELFLAGALDVWYIPIFMKKNRPAYMLSVLVKEENLKAAEQVIFRETTAIGLRKQKMERTVLSREIQVRDLPEGQVRMKVCSIGDETYCYPEYEDLRKISRETGVPVKELLRNWKL